MTGKWVSIGLAVLASSLGCGDDGGAPTDAGIVVRDAHMDSGVDAGAMEDAGPAHCDDGRTNEDETDVDCGGSCGGCLVDQLCGGDADCVSMACGSAGRCLGSSCGNGFVDGSETDIDCGGTCDGCDVGQGCARGLDCASGICDAGVCLLASCGNGIQDGDETDVDCGGSCAACSAMCGDAPCACAVADDCQSGTCVGAGECRDACFTSFGVGCDALAYDYLNPLAGQFGLDVAIDGDRLAVGAPIGGRGHVYMYVRSAEGVWTLEQDIQSSAPSTRGFGAYLALDGDVLVAGAPNSDAGAGQAWVFRRQGDGTWVEEQELVPSVELVRPDFFGGSVGLAGDWAAVGAPHANLNIEENMGWAGRVFVFHRRGGTWSETAVLDPTDMLSDLPEGYGFGNSLDMSEGILAIGATGDESTDQGVDADPSDRRGYKVGVVWAYRLEGESWVLDAFIKSETALTSDTFGHRVVLDGPRLLVGAPFEDRFGSGVISDPRGVGVTKSGGAYLFVRGVDGRWAQEAYFKASNPEPEDYFGVQLAIHGDLIAVQALREDSAVGALWSADPDDNSQTNVGAVYFYREFDDGWRLTSYLKGPYPDAFDRFGRGLAIGDWGFAVGAPDEDSGLSDDPSDNSDENNGSVYVFDVSRVELAEVCDGVDNDRDGMVDETATECGVACVEGRCE